MDNIKFPTFAKRFYQLRGDMSQDEFSKYLGISRPTVGFYENGVRVPDAMILLKIAERCNVSADWLLGLSDSPQRVEPVSQFPIINQMIVEYSEALSILAKEAKEKEVFEALFDNPVCGLFDECIYDAWVPVVNRCKWVLEHLETFRAEEGILDGNQILAVLQGK